MFAPCRPTPRSTLAGSGRFPRPAPTTWPSYIPDRASCSTATPTTGAAARIAGADRAGRRDPIVRSVAAVKPAPPTTPASLSPSSATVAAAGLQLAARYGPGSAAAVQRQTAVLRQPLGGARPLDLNTHRPLFSDARMRQAVNYAIDRRALAQLGFPFPAPRAPYRSLPAAWDARISGRPVYPLTPDLARARRSPRAPHAPCSTPAT